MKGKLFNYFKREFNINKPTTEGWYRFTNPLYSEGGTPSCGVNFNYDRVHDFRTGYSKSIINFIKDYEQVDYKNAVEIIKKEKKRLKLPKAKNKNKNKLKLPDNCKPLWLAKTKLGKRALKFLKSKKLKPEGLFYCDGGKYFGRIIIPVIILGKLEYFIARDFIGQIPKYLNVAGYSSSDLFYNEDALHTEERIYLVEGWSDAKTIGNQAVASFGWNISTVQGIKLSKCAAREIIVIADKGFYLHAIQSASWFMHTKKVKVVNIDPICTKDKKDVNDLGKKKVMRLVENTPYQSADRLVNQLILPF